MILKTTIITSCLVGLCKGILLSCSVLACQSSYVEVPRVERSLAHPMLAPTDHCQSQVCQVDYGISSLHLSCGILPDIPQLAVDPNFDLPLFSLNSQDNSLLLLSLSCPYAQNDASASIRSAASNSIAVCIEQLTTTPNVLAITMTDTFNRFASSLSTPAYSCHSCPSLVHPSSQALP